MASPSSPTAETHIARCGSGINVANFVSSKLRRDGKQNNYKSWKEQMLCLVESQGLLDFIDDEAPPPPPKDGAGYVAWRRTDRLVKGWILGALSDETLEDFVSHMDSDSAKDIWIDLENAFCAPSEDAPPPPPPSYPGGPQPAATLQHDSEVNVVDLVPVKLSRGSDWNTYKLWKNHVLSVVQRQNLGGFLDKTARPPPNNDANYGAWRQSDAMVKAWILEALSHELAPCFSHLNSAKDVWQELAKDFLATSKLARQEEKECRERLELYKVAMSDDLAKAEMILKQNPEAIRTRMDLTFETPLHIAVATSKSIGMVKKLVELSDDYTLSITDIIGYNPLHIAARMGNHRAAEILINKLPDLLYAQSNNNYFPIHCAADFAHRETVELLMHHTRDDLPINPFAGSSGTSLLQMLIIAGFLDMALDLVNRCPNLAWRISSVVDDTALSILASRDAVFSSGARLNFWENLVYSSIELETECSPPLPSFHDIESQNRDQPPWWRKRIRKLHSTLWKFISKLVPCVKMIHKRKSMHEQGLRLAKTICKHMESIGYERALDIYMPAMEKAATAGNHEIIEVIVGTFPQAIYGTDISTGQTFLHWAVRNRSEKVFNLLYQTTNHRYHYSNLSDSSGNSILHMAAFLAPPHKLNLVSGAALQMQRELQWLKEVAEFVSPNIRDHNNRAGKTPAMIFTEEHRNLKVEGEKWMKDTANSCTIAAALIVTVVFAAAITVPGGNESETGYPMLWTASAFTIFAVSDAVSLFTSTTSLLMFLSILTSRYAEQDFLYALPKRLCIGLVTLFLSIMFMMAAFCSTVFLVFGRKSSWVLIPAAALTCLPISSFVLLQFPLLIAVISSTYGKSIFRKQSNRPFPYPSLHQS